MLHKSGCSPLPGANCVLCQVKKSPQCYQAKTYFKGKVGKEVEKRISPGRTARSLAGES